jgi:2'-5' RNA ligase
MVRRLFFALNASVPLAETFLPTLKKLKINADKKELTMKWVPPENYHVTVTFIGDTPEADIPKIKEALAETCKVFNSFDLKIEDMGAFSNEHEARVLWLGVQNKRYLNELKHELDRQLQERGVTLPAEFREYQPHLTIGRLS